MESERTLKRRSSFARRRKVYKKSDSSCSRDIEYGLCTRLMKLPRGSSGEDVRSIVSVPLVSHNKLCAAIFIEAVAVGYNIFNCETFFPRQSR